MTRSTFVNALVGAVVSVVLSVVPFSPVLGGAVAAYLEGEDGVRTGAYAGALAAVPMVAVLFVLFAVGFAGFNGSGAVGLLVVVGLVSILAVAYTVALSALGGWVGEYFLERAAEKRQAGGVEPAV